MSKTPDFTELNMQFTEKHAELYWAQMAVKDGLIEQFEGGVFTFDRRVILDQLSLALGLEENSVRHTMLGNTHWRPIVLKTVKQKVEQYRKIASRYGVLKAIATDDSLFALRAINSRARSGKGHNAFATGMFAHEYDIFLTGKGKYLSPYKVEKLIWATKEKSLSKHGQVISFEDALWALGYTKSSSKAATIATAKKRGWLKGIRLSEITFRLARNLFVYELGRGDNLYEI